MDLYPPKQKFLEDGRTAISNFDWELICHVWDFAVAAHADQMRETGESYFSHPVGVAYALLNTKCDTAAVAAALLHDIVEDTEVSLEEIRHSFGSEVASLVEGVTKLAPLDLAPNVVWTKEKTRRENLRKLFISIVDDPRVAMIKLADRLHNLTSLGVLTEDRQRRIARESLEVFAPLAEALGLGVFQSRIQSLAFRYLQPEIYEELERKVKERQAEFEVVQQVAVALLEEALEEAGITGLVYTRQKELYSIYRKMRDMHLEFEEVYDIIGIRIIVETEEDCYKAKYVVDQLGIEVKFDDYVQRPRGPLGYQSLHKVVLDAPGGTLIEVQIRTMEMHERAERGAAAHWMYKLGTSSADPSLVRRIASLRDTLESLGEALASFGDDEAEEISIGELVKVIREDGLAPRIHVLSPRGDIISLPIGATPIDFAYHIHTELGHECHGARVNGKFVALDYELSAGDTVEIIRRKGQEPSLNWLSERKAKSSRARQKIRQYFRTQKRQQTIASGRELVRKCLKQASSLDLQAPDLVTAFTRANLLNDQTEEELYLAVAESRISIERLKRTIGILMVDRCLRNANVSRELDHLYTQRLAELLEDDELPLDERPDLLFIAIAEGRISEDGLKRAIGELRNYILAPYSSMILPSVKDVAEARHFLTHLAQCCYPVPGDPIVGYVTVGRGLSIHRATCPSVFASHRRERTIEVEWESLDLSDQDMCSGELFVVLADSSSETFKEIQEMVSKVGGVIRALTPMGTSKRFLSQIRLTVDVKDIHHLENIQTKLRHIDAIVDVRRSLEDK
jgi:guanosine-3',5'-bis(diphosphate) 3'-pyrophosphohydrolase